MAYREDAAAGGPQASGSGDDGSSEPVGTRARRDGAPPPAQKQAPAPAQSPDVPSATTQSAVSAPAGEGAPKPRRGIRKRWVLRALFPRPVRNGLLVRLRYWKDGRFMVSTDDAYVAARHHDPRLQGLRLRDGRRGAEQPGRRDRPGAGADRRRRRAPRRRLRGQQAAIEPGRDRPDRAPDRGGRRAGRPGRAADRGGPRRCRSARPPISNARRSSPRAISPRAPVSNRRRPIPTAPRPPSGRPRRGCSRRAPMSRC